MKDDSSFYALIISWVFLLCLGIIMYIKADNKHDHELSLLIILTSFVPAGNMIVALLIIMFGLLWLFEIVFKKVSDFFYNLKFKK